MMVNIYKSQKLHDILAHAFLAHLDVLLKLNKVTGYLCLFALRDDFPRPLYLRLNVFIQNAFKAELT